MKTQHKIYRCIGIALLLMSPQISADQAANRTALDAAIPWVESVQNADGSWGSDEFIRYLTTSAIVESLRVSNQYKGAYFAGIAWLENHQASNVDFVSRKIASLSRRGNNLSDDLSYLQIARQTLSQEGWGLSQIYTSSAIDTAVALNALIINGDLSGQSGAINFLQISQLADGGWALSSSLNSDPWISAYVYSVLASITAPSAQVTTLLNTATPLLTSVSSSSSNLVLAQTALALYRAQGAGVLVDQLVSQLLANQNAAGDWGDFYTTATAMRLLASVLGMDNDSFIQSANITDQSLRRIINVQLGNNAFDNLIQGELQQFTTLDLRGSDVLTLAGLEGASNLLTIQVNASTDTSALSGVTIVVDTDSDNIVDSLDNCPLIANADQANLDGDVFGDVCDSDIDGDGFTIAQGDTDDFDASINPGAIDICGDGIDQNGNGLDAVCGDINVDGLINVGDLVLAQRHQLGLIVLDAQQVAAADMYPANAPDGIISISDILLLNQAILNGQ